MKHILVIIVLAISQQTLALEEELKPNILFIFADDLVFDAFGKMSNGYIKTPNLDELAEQGVHFSKAYNMGSWTGAVCLASRTQLNIGRTLWRSKEFHLNPIKLNTWSQRLQNAGYHTYMTGKWHVDSIPVEDVFNQLGTIRAGMPITSKNDQYRPKVGEIDTWDASDKTAAGYWEGGIHWSERTANEAIDYLKQRSQAKDGNPFFAYVAFNAPHDPRQSPQEYLDMYPVNTVPVPPAFLPSYPYSKQTGTYDIRAEKMAPRPRTEFAIQTHRREYYALISHMDTQIGRILDELEKLDLSKNTRVVFTADHGLSIGNHSFMAKQSMYDHSLAAPLIMSGPNIPKNKTSSQRLYIQDIVPTTLDWAKADKSDIEFKSIVLDESGQLKRPEEHIYGGYKDFSRVLIKQNWKLVVYPKVPTLRLFDLKNDPYEVNDLANNKLHYNRVQIMLSDIIVTQKDYGDDLDLSDFMQRFIAEND